MISVIVPIYNVEAYLTKCLDSLARQTMADVEFILVDDGSTDRSGEIAEQYRDDRFRVFHTENHGLSAARNFGIEKAHGDWLMFVDSDDWVEPDFCKKPYEAAIYTGADVVIFQFYSKKHHKIKKNRVEMPLGTISNSIAIKFGYVMAWNKLYRRKLFAEIRYPVGMVYEDLATTHRLLYIANRIVVIPEFLYCHVYRKNSIQHTQSFEKLRDRFIACCLHYDFLLKTRLDEETLDHALLIPSIRLLATNCPHNDPVCRIAREIVKTTKGWPKGLSLKTKAALWLWRRNKYLFSFFCRLIEKK